MGAEICLDCVRKFVCADVRNQEQFVHLHTCKCEKCGRKYFHTKSLHIYTCGCGKMCAMLLRVRSNLHAHQKIAHLHMRVQKILCDVRAGAVEIARTLTVCTFTRDIHITERLLGWI